MTDAHEQDEEIIEHDLIAAHAERAESELFRHNKALLGAQHTGCWFNTDVCDASRPIEAHHIVEWSEWPKVDPIRLKALLISFDPYGYSARMAAQPIDTPDDIRNLILLYDRCHRGVGLGAHHLTWPTSWARKARRDGENITAEERAMRSPIEVEKSN